MGNQKKQKISNEKIMFPFLLMYADGSKSYLLNAKVKPVAVLFRGYWICLQNGSKKMYFDEASEVAKKTQLLGKEVGLLPRELVLSFLLWHSSLYDAFALLGGILQKNCFWTSSRKAGEGVSEDICCEYYIVKYLRQVSVAEVAIYETACEDIAHTGLVLEQSFYAREAKAYPLLGCKPE